jgi:hypothetical protein
LLVNPQRRDIEAHCDEHLSVEIETVGLDCNAMRALRTQRPRHEHESVMKTRTDDDLLRIGANPTGACEVIRESAAQLDAAGRIAVPKRAVRCGCERTSCRRKPLLAGKIGKVRGPGNESVNDSFPGTGPNLRTDHLGWPTKLSDRGA